MIGIGNDIQSIPEFSRARELLEPGLFFTEAEWKHGQGASAGAVASLAGIFSAKEAFFKALPQRALFCWIDMEVCYTETGAPYFRFHGELDRLMKAYGWRTLLSISHSADYATAFVVIKE